LVPIDAINNGLSTEAGFIACCYDLLYFVRRGKMKRYEMSYADSFWCMDERDDGGYVKWKDVEKLQRENANLLKLLHDHQNHWNTIGCGFGLCMGGVDGNVTDLHGNAALIIEHCLNVAEKAKKETAADILQFIVDQGTIECGENDPYFVVQDDLIILREKFGLEI
jgi:hypothetical protein